MSPRRKKIKACRLWQRQLGKQMISVNEHVIKNFDLNSTIGRIEGINFINQINPRGELSECIVRNAGVQEEKDHVGHD